MNRKLFLILLVSILSVKVFAQTSSPIYSFFTAGHTYGNPNSPQYGLHPPFVSYFPEINDYPTMEIGFLTGDVVVYGTAAYWDSAQADISLIDVPVYIAPGNHDIGAQYVARFNDYFYSFIHQNDLFVILTPGLDSWNISGTQLDFLTNTLDTSYMNVDHIFIILHELIWWSPDNQYQNVDINYEPHYPGSTNFDTVVKPLLLSYPKPITMYAGDLGCIDQVSPFMYDHFDNITLIASGMGGGIRDNIIITDVYPDSVHYNLVAINGSDPDALGELSDFTLYSSDNNIVDNEIKIFPNPAADILYIQSDSEDILAVEIIDVHGKCLYSENNRYKSIDRINIRQISAGYYFVRILAQEMVYTKRIIIQ